MCDPRAMMLKACLNGWRSPSEHPALPTTPAAIAKDAAAVVAAGADALHVHPKGDDGADTLEPQMVAEVVAAVRAAVPGIPIGVTTGAWTAHDRGVRFGRAAIEGRWATTMRFYAGPACLIIDELGYLPLPGEAASALFQVVNQRYLKSSIIMTTNRPVTSWGEVLGDTTVAAALLDRLLHRSVVIDINGDSYRLRDHHARNDNLRRALRPTTPSRGTPQ